MEQGRRKGWLWRFIVNVITPPLQRMAKGTKPETPEEREERHRQADEGWDEVRAKLGIPIDLHRAGKTNFAMSWEMSWALAGVAFLLIPQIGTVPPPRGFALNLALLCLVCSMPLLLASGAVGYVHRDPKVRWLPWGSVGYAIGMQAAALVLLYIGVAAYLGGLNGWFVVAFLYFSLLAKRLHFRIILALNKVNLAQGSAEVAKRDVMLIPARCRLMDRHIRRRRTEA
jgi:hypothetical protein